MKRKPKGPKLNIDLLVDYARDCLLRVTQWGREDIVSWKSTAAEYAAKAEAAIEMLEKHCHASVGAVDADQQYTGSLHERLQWIIDNYQDTKK